MNLNFLDFEQPIAELEAKIEEFQKGIIVRAEKIPEDLPEMLHGGLIERENTKSLIIAPLSVSNRVIGSLSFISYRKERKWPDDLIRRIKLIGEIMANTIQRIHSQQALSEEVERRQMLEEAAGIAGLHVRRKDAESKLRSTEKNLERLEDLNAVQP